MLQRPGAALVRAPRVAAQLGTIADTAVWLPPVGAVWQAPDAEVRDATRRLHERELARWRRHPLYRGSDGARLVDSIHGWIRRRFDLILLDLAKQEVTAPQVSPRVRPEQYRLLSAFLHHHHKVEDRKVFPAFLKKQPDMQRALAWLDSDHAHLQPFDHSVRKDGSAQAFREYYDFVDVHLNREELLIVPLVLNGRL
jgi:hypothetical protein